MVFLMNKNFLAAIFNHQKKHVQKYICKKWSENGEIFRVPIKTIFPCLHI